MHFYADRAAQRHHDKTCPDCYKPSHDRIYPRCPVCRTEQYGPAVIEFSSGKCPCHKCGHVIRENARLSR